jgi:predicted transcriptional regulator
MVKTTVYLDADVALQLRHLAGAEGRSQAELIREALAAYAGRSQTPLPAGTGRFRSGRSDVAENRRAILRDAARTRRWR